MSPLPFPLDLLVEAVSPLAGCLDPARGRRVVEKISLDILIGVDLGNVYILTEVPFPKGSNIKVQAFCGFFLIPLQSETSKLQR